MTRSVELNGDVLDTSATPTKAPSTSAVLAVVARDIANPVATGYYPVYTDIPRGHNGYCAWHSNGTAKGVSVQFAFFFNLDGDPGCDPQDTSGLHSQSLAALANVSGHELSETLTDPSGVAGTTSRVRRTSTNAPGRSTGSRRSPVAPNGSYSGTSATTRTSPRTATTGRLH